MKKFFYSFSVVLAAAFAVSCEDAAPEATPQPISISGEYTAYVYGGGYGWQKDAKIGVFANSSVKVQNNLQYYPSATTAKVVGENPVEIKDVQLLPVSESVEFNAGMNVYAYYPYDATVENHTAVKVPNISTQDFQSDSYWTSPNFKYAFAYAKLNSPLENYTTEAVSLGNFVPLYYDLEVIGATVADELDGKYLTEVTINSSRTIALAEATINLATGEISGAKSNSIKVVFPAPGYLIETQSFYGMTFTETPMMNIAAYLESELAEGDIVSVVYKIDGQDYEFAATASKSRFYDAYSVIPF